MDYGELQKIIKIFVQKSEYNLINRRPVSALSLESAGRVRFLDVILSNQDLFIVWQTEKKNRKTKELWHSLNAKCDNAVRHIIYITMNSTSLRITR